MITQVLQGPYKICCMAANVKGGSLELAVSHKETAISFLRTPVYTFVYRVGPRATHGEISS